MGVGPGSDTGGFNALPGPDPRAKQHPFRAFHRDVRFRRERTGARTFDLNADGVAHYGLVPDLLADVARRRDGRRALRLLFHSAEAYLPRAIPGRGLRRITFMKVIRLVAAASVAIVAFAGCGGGGGKKTVTPSAGGGAAAGTVVKETEYALAPGSIKVTKQGAVTLTAQNAGKMTHALEVEGNGVEKRTADIQPGSSAKLTVNLKPGTYDVYCPIDGHRQLGMKASLTVG